MFRAKKFAVLVFTVVSDAFLLITIRIGEHGTCCETRVISKCEKVSRSNAYGSLFQEKLMRILMIVGRLLKSARFFDIVAFRSHYISQLFASLIDAYMFLRFFKRSGIFLRLRWNVGFTKFISMCHSNLQFGLFFQMAVNTPFHYFTLGRYHRLFCLGLSLPKAPRLLLKVFQKKPRGSTFHFPVVRAFPTRLDVDIRKQLKICGCYGR